LYNITEYNRKSGRKSLQKQNESFLIIFSDADSRLLNFFFKLLF